MTRTRANLALGLILCATAPAATIPTKVIVNATAKLSSSSFVIAGTANFTGGIIGDGKIASTVSLSSVDLAGTNAVADYTITLSGGTLTGKLSVPILVAISGATPSASVSLTVTGGTGTYALATSGTTPIILTGSITGDILGGYNLVNFTGSGTIVTGGTGGGGGGTGAGPTPTVTDVLDSASNTANVAQGSIFIVKGTSLCPSGTKFFDLPRPTVAPDGVKVTFTPTAGGTGTDTILVYEFNPSGVCQLAAILPSTVATGNYLVTVTNGSPSGPFPAQVVQRKPTLFTQDSSGSGLAAVQNFISQSSVDYNGFTTGIARGVTVSPAKPGQVLIAYATGLGALAGSDNIANPAYDFNAHGVAVTAIVGGVTIPVSYAGRAGYAGQDQINFALPGNLPTGCAVPFQISANGILSQTTFIAIAPDANSSACVMPGFTSDQLKKFDNGGTYTLGSFTLNHSEMTSPLGTSKTDLIGGGFFQFTGFQLARAAGQIQAITPTVTDSCVVSHLVFTNMSVGPTPTPTPAPSIRISGLDAGAITLIGPAASGITGLALTEDPTFSTYSATIAPAGTPGQANAGTLVAGTYTLTGAGGKDVKPFNASVTFGSPLSVTGGLPASVNRSGGLTLNWTGGNSSDLVEISGSANIITGSAVSGGSQTIDFTSFVCTTTAGKGGFTVPASILTQLPAVTGTANGSGFLTVVSGGIPTNGNGLFTAQLTAGGSIDLASFLATSNTSGAVNFQ